MICINLAGNKKLLSVSKIKFKEDVMLNMDTSYSSLLMDLMDKINKDNQCTIVFQSHKYLKMDAGLALFSVQYALKVQKLRI